MDVNVWMKLKLDGFMHLHDFFLNIGYELAKTIPAYYGNSRKSSHYLFLFKLPEIQVISDITDELKHL